MSWQVFPKMFCVYLFVCLFFEELRLAEWVFHANNCCIVHTVIGYPTALLHFFFSWHASLQSSTCKGSSCLSCWHLIFSLVICTLPCSDLRGSGKALKAASCLVCLVAGRVFVGEIHVCVMPLTSRAWMDAVQYQLFT